MIVTSLIVREYIEYDTRIPMFIVGFGGQDVTINIAQEYYCLELFLSL